ncbi:MAG: shikimate kinase [Planctomycetaceae bacterium]|nr:shikimate kinase [Planctomycetaceae bacterium]
MNPERIILIGYRGSGKTTVGRLLAQKLGWEFADADDHLEGVAGKSIAEIFKAEGETGFRNRESAALADLCQRSRLVIATGGGAILRPANRDLLRSAGVVAWLATNPETSWKRLQGDPTTASRRPNLTPAGGFEEVQNLIAARTPLYRELAHFCADTDAQSPEEVAAAILNAWNCGLTRSSRSGASGSSSSD